ncbi:MAG: UDP-N-acetylmuramoyl-tripeptide--D-alanyl-D-alanine ligase, partial [Acidobacteria bacterium]|nr:UDP-N-acetylmuramoyl-tripeptide--D-alanyl-D-alanine ligase [Acidobacteriota bacterium]
VGRSAADLGFSPVFAVGDFAGSLAEGVLTGGAEGRVFSRASEAAPAAAAELRAGDLVLVKGSRGVGLDVVVEALTSGRRAAGGSC